MVLDGWRLLRAGDGPGVLLAVDFTLAKVRAQANFGDLATLLPGGPAVRGTEESGWPATAGSPARHLERWLTRHRGLGGVRGVLGFCAGAPLAGALAAGLAGDGPPPPVVLLDPVVPTAQTMIGQCADAVRRMAPASAGPPDDLGDLGDLDDLDGLATALTAWYTSVAGPVCADQGVPPSIVEQLRGRLESNLRYLALSATAGPPAADAALLVLSRDHEVPPRVRGTRVVRLALGQNDLLADPGTARAVAEALLTTTPAGRP